jgi:PAS domain-containing protein
MGEADEVERSRGENEELLESLNLLEQARDGYAELYELAPLALFVVSAGPHYLVQGLNLAAAELLGCQREVLCGRPFADLIHERDRALVLSGLRGERSKLKHAQARLLGSDGEVTVRLTAVASKTEPGQLHVSASPVVEP